MNAASRVAIASAVLLSLATPSLLAQERISFDVKTKLPEKNDLAPAKFGTILYLLDSDWATVTEVGEDYSLWLTS